MSIFQDIFEKHFQDQKIVGIGTGRTVKAFIESVDFTKAKNTLFVPSSVETEKMLQKKGLRIQKLSDTTKLDLYFDSADFVDGNNNLIKGGGAAHLKEKISMNMSHKNIIIVDNKKCVSDFTAKTVPLEISVASLSFVTNTIKKQGLNYSIRTESKSKSPFITENHNMILDVEYDKNFLIKCKEIPGVLEHGLFLSEFFHPNIEKIQLLL